jgi:hypothetical protein
LGSSARNPGPLLGTSGEIFIALATTTTVIPLLMSIQKFTIGFMLGIVGATSGWALWRLGQRSADGNLLESIEILKRNIMEVSRERESIKARLEQAERCGELFIPVA